MLGLEIAWGPVGGLCMANDDIKFVRHPARDLPPLDAIAQAWRTEPSFRPLEVIMAHLSDPVSLECPWVVPVQAAGLLALAAGTVALARLSMPGLPLMWPAALALVLLSPATTAAVWQMDACSQTWSAALGAWSVWLAWRWIASSDGDRAPWWTLLALSAAVLAGLTIKENFYGWALGIAAACTVAIAVAWFRRGAVSIRAAWVLAPAALLPLAHVLCRWRWSALPGLLGGSGEESRYQAEFGTNLLVNAAVSVAGALGTGPFHLVLDVEASVPIRALTVVATGALAAVTLLGVGAAFIDGSAARGVRWPALAFAASASALSLVATIPMPAVSELYGLGANVGCALLVLAAASVLWRAGDGSPRPIARGVLALAFAIVALVGTYGLVSRAMHFRVLWTAVRTMNDAIISFQPTLPATSAHQGEAAGTVHLPTSCLVGGTHSQYVMPPMQAIDTNMTEAWLARRDPTRRIVFSISTSPRVPRASEIVIDCATMPQHGHW
jgi:hypothetical protein